MRSRAIKPQAAELVCKLTKDLRDQSIVEGVQAECVRALEAGESEEYVGSLVQALAAQAAEGKLGMKQMSFDFGESYEEQARKIAKWLARGLKDVNEAIGIIKSRRKLRGEKKSLAEEMGYDVSRPEGEMDILMDLETIKAQFEHAGSYPELIEAARRWDGESEIPNAAREYLAAAKAEREQMEAEKEMDAAQFTMSFSVVSAVEKEMEGILKEAKANGTYLKAPNGADTKLTPHLWALVRTRAFKEWFGDWEKVATFNSGMEKLEKMKPVGSITGNEFAPTGKNDLVQRVVDYWAQYGNVAHNPMLGDVKLDTRAAKDSMAHGIRRLKSAAFAAVRDVIERGVFIEYAPDWKNRGKDSYVFAAPVTVNGEDCICEVIIMKDANRTGFYLHGVQVKEKLLDVFKTGLYTGTSGALKSIIMNVAGRVKDIEKVRRW